MEHEKINVALTDLGLLMATVTAWYTYADGDSVGASVEMPTPYPDALAEAVHTCADMLREAMVSGIVVQQGEDDGDDAG